MTSASSTQCAGAESQGVLTPSPAVPSVAPGCAAKCQSRHGSNRLAGDLGCPRELTLKWGDYHGGPYLSTERFPIWGSIAKKAIDGVKAACGRGGSICKHSYLRVEPKLHQGSWKAPPAWPPTDCALMGHILLPLSTLGGIPPLSTECPHPSEALPSAARTQVTIASSRKPSLVPPVWI